LSDWKREEISERETDDDESPEVKDIYGTEVIFAFKLSRPSVLIPHYCYTTTTDFKHK